MKKCINPDCNGLVNDTFCQNCIKIDILDRIVIYLMVNRRKKNVHK